MELDRALSLQIGHVVCFSSVGFPTHMISGFSVMLNCSQNKIWQDYNLLLFGILVLCRYLGTIDYLLQFESKRVNTISIVRGIFPTITVYVEYFPFRKHAITLRFMIMKYKYDSIIISRIMQLRTINSLHHASRAYIINSRRWRDIFILTISSCACICITVTWYIYTLGCSQVAANRLGTACHVLFLVLLDIYVFNQSNSTCNTMESSKTYISLVKLSKSDFCTKAPIIYKRRIQKVVPFYF